MYISVLVGLQIPVGTTAEQWTVLLVLQNYLP